MRNFNRMLLAAMAVCALFGTMAAQDTTSFRMAAFTDSGELVLFKDDSTTMYVGLMNSNASYNALFHDPASGDLYCLHDTLIGNGDRRFFKFDPFAQSVSFAYAPSALFLAAACAGPNGKVYTVTGNSQVAGVIYEVDLANQTSNLFTTTDFTFGGSIATGLNITYYEPANELWLFGGGADSLIKINVTTLAEQRVACSLFQDDAIKATYLDGDFFWLASNQSYNLDINAGLFATPSTFPIYGYITDFEMLDLIIGGDTIGLCSGDSVALTSRFMADGFAWYRNDTLLGPTHPSIQVTQPGTYRLLAHSDNGYDMWSEEVVLVIGTSPAASFSQSADTVLLGTMVNFTDLSVGGSSYAWNFGDGNTSNSASPSHTYAAVGTYNVMQVVVNGACSDTAYSQVVVIPLVGIQNGGPLQNIGDLLCLPNPASATAEIKFSLSVDTDLRIEVLNSMGQSVSRVHDGVLRIGTHRFTWSLQDDHGSEVANGLYFLRLVTGEGNLSRRIMVQH